MGSESMAFEQLLEWTANRPEWQQDALRRLAQSGELTEDDLSELRLQIENSAGLPVDNVPAPIPLAAEHLSEAASNQPKTVLASLGPVRSEGHTSELQSLMRISYAVLCLKKKTTNKQKSTT